MIIDCPFCRTKFSVADTTLHSLSHAKFHCSRCDNVFEQQINSAIAPVIELNKANLTEKKHTTVENIEPKEQVSRKNITGVQLEFWKEEKVVEPITSKNQNRELHSILNSRKHSLNEAWHSLNNDEVETGIRASWPDGSQSSQFEADIYSTYSSEYLAHIKKKPILANRLHTSAKAGDKYFSLKTDKEKTAVALQADDWLFDENDYKARGKQVEDTQGVTPSFDKKDWTLSESSSAAKEQYLQDFEARNVHSACSVAPILDAPPLLIDDLVDDFSDETITPASSDIISFSRKNKNTDRKFTFSQLFSSKKSAGSHFLSQRQWVGISSPVATFILVPLAACFLHFQWSKNIEKTPTLLTKIFGLEASDALQLPPREMDLVDISGEVVTLDDGNRMLAISGSVLNATKSRFGELALEARVYNDKNQELKRIIVNTNNQLTRTNKIQTLTEETLIDLQNTESSTPLTIAPNDKLPFKILLPNYSDEMSWFGTAIYSVREGLRS